MSFLSPPDTVWPKGPIDDSFRQKHMRRLQADYYAECAAGVYGNPAEVVDRIAVNAGGTAIGWNMAAQARFERIRAAHPRWPAHECMQQAYRELIRELEGRPVAAAAE